MEKSFETPTPIRLDLRVPAGRVDVEATPTAATRVRLDGDAELLARTTVELDGGLLRVDVPRRKGLFVPGTARVEVSVTCPERSSVRVLTRSADVETKGLLGDVRAGTASGDIALDRLEAGSAETASGDVRVGEAAGDLSVQSASGDVSIGRTGPLVVHVVSGDLRVREATGAVTAGSVSGDVALESVEAGHVKVESVSGAVRVGIRRGSHVRVDASSLSGATRSELELGDDPVPGDGPAVDMRVQTVSGDVAIVRAAVSAATEEVGS